MKPKNSKERYSSFLKFLLLFLLTTATAVGAIYFNFRIPSKDNELLRTQAKTFDSEIKFQNAFYNETELLRALMDSLVDGQDLFFINGQIGTKLAELKESVPTEESTYLYNMHMSFIDMFVDLQTAKNRLLELNEAEDDIEFLKSELEDCNDDVNRLRRELRATLN